MLFVWDVGNSSARTDCAFWDAPRRNGAPLLSFSAGRTRQLGGGSRIPAASLAAAKMKLLSQQFC